jgi:hypothetical protein
VTCSAQSARQAIANARRARQHRAIAVITGTRTGDK